jgi:hypothetical protein
MLLRCERMRRKQQQRKFEVLQLSKESATLSVMIQVNAMLRMQLSIEHTLLYNVSYHQNMHIIWN